jgi:hypothetical protein
VSPSICDVLVARRSLPTHPGTDIPMADIAEVGVTTQSVSDLDEAVFHRETWMTTWMTTFPAVLTPYTFASSCGRHWIQSSPDDIRSSLTIEGGRAASSYFSRCFPQNTNTFSPGVYPSGYYLATITEFTRIVGAADDRLWQAYCCSR